MMDLHGLCAARRKIDYTAKRGWRGSDARQLSTMVIDSARAADATMRAMSDIPRQVYVPPMRPGDVPPCPKVIDSMGEENVVRMMSDFYSELEQSSIRDMFPADMQRASQKSALFFITLLGGPPYYAQIFGNPAMRARHMPFEITPAARNVWMACFERVLAHPERYSFPADKVEPFLAFLRGFSMWMVNTAEQPTA
jgi:hemoglobin